MLSSMGVQIEKSEVEEDGTKVYQTRIIPPNRPLTPIQLILPGDISAAAFLIVAALITPGSEITIPGVGINPTRIGLIDALRSMGGDIEIQQVNLQAGEPVGDIKVRYSRLKGSQVNGPLVVRMIDEFSIFGTAAVYASGQTAVSDAAELRLKESDRIQTLCQELSKLGVAAQEAEDGFTIQGGILPGGGTVQSHGDHRLAMAMAVLGLGASAPVSIEGAEMIDESFPGFIDCLQELGANLSIVHEEPA
jgi:3-phosphoshikimate 1-carboxyvinyltransferase